MKSGVEPDQHAPADQRGGCIFIPGAPVRTVRQLDADSALHAACGARRDVRAVQGPRSLILLFSFLSLIVLGVKSYCSLASALREARNSTIEIRSRQKIALSSRLGVNEHSSLRAGSSADALLTCNCHLLR